MLYKIFAAALAAAFTLLLLPGCKDQAKPSETAEVIYHVCQRSFYDSNGDFNGDLNGLREKLDYLQDLGVTSILLLPLYESVYHHNYFASDFKKIDPEFGTTDDYLALVKDIHSRGMKLYMDMETQYVTQEHIWYKDSYNNPKSKYSNYILYDDSAQTKPSTIVFELNSLKGYDGVEHKITTVNLKNKDVLEYNYELFKYFADPNNDGNFDDGVDGFRLDHAMDTLDLKPRLTGLFKAFWSPLLTRLKQVNPKLNFVAEQADWSSLGIDYLTKANVDRVFNFRLAFAIREFDRDKIMAMADSSFSATPAGKQQVVFIENHDMPRFAQVVKKNAGKEKVGAALNILIGGVPSIYYGQEIGMVNGDKPDNVYGPTDANGIPLREAFEWYSGETGKGMSVWYKDTGPWWTDRNMKPNDGISYEEQKGNKNSLWNFYKTVIALRKNNQAIGLGQYQTLPNSNKQVVSFLRYTHQQAVMVLVNLSATAQKAEVYLSASKVPVNRLGSLMSNKSASAKDRRVTIELPGYGVEVFDVK
ncbi:alpha-amylase [Mucilaginibacter hurinus]|uniref:Alpha-amylase n=1 Tax=Mucilaginibacter hurinus TaxID=2201324 RepID=A0A367GT61_9SPHI|nr:alpha-amylase family glycosyl hydrolase [Mucilaginibacter hurinus]RCH56450.1 alpha-amylase [Mucilaginibacter hurinus]